MAAEQSNSGMERGFGEVDRSAPIQCDMCGTEKPYNEIDWDEWSWERPSNCITQVPYCPDCSHETEGDRHE